MHGLIKMYKENNPLRVITSGRGTTIEYLSNYYQKYRIIYIKKSIK